MEQEEQEHPMTENLLLFVVSQAARQRGSRVFFKVFHNLSPGRGWHFWSAPDMDLVEVRTDNTIVAYEVKGQRKGKNGYNWPAWHDGLDQALAYLTLPKVTNETGQQRMFGGGVPDFVYLVHPLPFQGSVDPLDLRVISLTPIGFIGVLPFSIDRNHKNSSLALGEVFASELDKIIEVAPAKRNPLQDARAKTFFLENLGSLESFGEGSRIFGGQIKRAALDYLGIQSKGRLVVDQMVNDEH